MKNQLFISMLFAFLALTSCKEKAEAEHKEGEDAVIETPDYAAFDANVNVIRAFINAHANEDLEAQTAILADTLKWSPPDFNGNTVLDKADYVEQLKAYHDNFENISFTEGIQIGDLNEPGFWSGSVFPEGSANSAPTAIRTYGTWRATHTASGKEIGVKWFGLAWVNKDGKIAQMSEYFDVNGIATQLAD